MFTSLSFKKPYNTYKFYTSSSRNNDMQFCYVSLKSEVIRLHKKVLILYLQLSL